MKLHRSSRIHPNHQNHLVLSVCSLQFFSLTSCPVLKSGIIYVFLSNFPPVWLDCTVVMFSTCVSWFSSTTFLSASFPEESPTVWLNFWICPPSLTMILYLYLIFAFLVYRFWTKWKTLIYSNTHPVPVCPSLRVLCLIENTSKQLWRKNLWGDHKSQSKWQFPSEVCEASVLSCKKKCFSALKVLQLLEWCLKCLPLMCSALIQEQ